MFGLSASCFSVASKRRSSRMCLIHRSSGRKLSFMPKDDLLHDQITPIQNYINCVSYILFRNKYIVLNVLFVRSFQVRHWFYANCTIHNTNGNISWIVSSASFRLRFYLCIIISLTKHETKGNMLKWKYRGITKYDAVSKIH